MDTPAPAPASPLLGIAAMCGGVLFFAFVDAQAKLLTAHFHPFQIVWCRQLGLVLAAMALLAWHGPSLLRTATPRLQIFRGVVAAGSVSCFIFAVKFVPLADAVAVSFVAPFFVTILGVLVLGERVGARRWAAIAVGFCATLVIIRPGLGVFQPAILLVVLAAGLFAVRLVISRLIAAGDRTATTVAYTALVSLTVMSVPLPFVWFWPETWWQVGLLVSVAGFAALAETLVIKSMELAQAVILAPLHYTILIWSTFYGWLFFAELPDLWTWVGVAIIVATGIYMLHRERLAARRAAK
jgi:S-adenosylmethionine uptake transporter